MDKLKETLGHTLAQFLTMEFIDIIDIAIVTALIFFAIRFISDKRASKLALGICTLVLLVLISEVFQMSAINFIFSNVMQVGIILIVILFQSEIRSALEKIGGASSELKILPNVKEHRMIRNRNRRIEAISALCEAVQELSADYTGALIVVERDTPTDDLVKNSTVINADINVPLIKNIFYNKAPLHDGAMIIRKSRIYSAGCVLPLSRSDDITKSLGTRHRAAIGMSENSDAIVIVVSEETGTISVAMNGSLRRNYDYNLIKSLLIQHLITDVENAKKAEEAAKAASAEKNPDENGGKNKKRRFW